MARDIEIVNPLTAGEKLALGRLLAALNEFQGLDPNMPLQMIRVFLVAAIHEGSGSNYIASKAGLVSGPAARYLGDWGEFDRRLNPSYGFITDRTTIKDRRAKLKVFTPKGRAFLGRLFGSLHSRKEDLVDALS